MLLLSYNNFQKPGMKRIVLFLGFNMLAVLQPVSFSHMNIILVWSLRFKLCLNPVTKLHTILWALKSWYINLHHPSHLHCNSTSRFTSLLKIFTYQPGFVTLVDDVTWLLASAVLRWHKCGYSVKLALGSPLLYLKHGWHRWRTQRSLMTS